MHQVAGDQQSFQTYTIFFHTLLIMLMLFIETFIFSWSSNTLAISALIMVGLVNFDIYDLPPGMGIVTQPDTSHDNNYYGDMKGLIFLPHAMDTGQRVLRPL